VSKKKGAKPIISSSAIEIKLKELLIEFDEKHNMRSKIAYKDFSEYIQSLSEKKMINLKPPSYSWWKTKGKYLIDDYNKVKVQTIRVGETEQIDTADLMDAIEKYGGSNKDILRKLIIPTDRIVKRLEERVLSQEEKIKILNKELSEKVKRIKQIVDENEKLQQLILSLFSYTQKSDSGLHNLLNTGKTKSNEVNLSLEKTFGDPLAYFNQLKNKLKFTTPNLVRENNILQFPSDDPSERTKQTSEEDYDF
jgi:uncharacterized coiled-coil protein SlyX